jgi:FKBP-type peptidyl-prolyl cis-trans isomerase
MSLTTLPSGLTYEIITPASETAQTAKAGNVVTVHYTGWLQVNGAQGAKFDSSVDRGQKFSFILGAGQVIQGWDQGVAGMKVGEKRRLVIPAQLAYGNRSVGGVIPANSTLIFDVELFEVK